ncbi:MAG: DNA mismatch repair protein MutS [Patescibacteria group bacterium]
MQDYDFSTPMMKQYIEIKKDYQDCFLFFRMGDFYELFLDDAKTGAQLLDITLTSRAKGRDGRVPMAGVPYHALDSYLHRLVKAGHKAAICEQITPPNKQGIVERKVVRVVTPGTLMHEAALDRKTNNYIVSIHQHDGVIAIAAADISTGTFLVHEQSVPSGRRQVLRSGASSSRADLIANELTRFLPSECIVADEWYNDADFLTTLTRQAQMNIFAYPDWQTASRKAEQILTNHFKVPSLHPFHLHGKVAAQQTAAVLLHYLQMTQQSSIQHIKTISWYSPNEGMMLDRSTIVNLELFQTIREQERQGSLCNLLDQTITAMGGRLFKVWLSNPLTSRTKIQERLDLVEEILQQRQLRAELREHLREVLDIERIIGRLSVGLGNPKDLIALKDSLKKIYELKELVARLTSPLAGELISALSPTLLTIIDHLDSHILPDPSFDPKGGGVMQDGVDPELDRLREIVRKGKGWVSELERQERDRTGISSLKVRFNSVFGFYIEVSKANLGQVPKEYERRQTLVNAERFITPELKEQEEVILTAEENMCQIEYEQFLGVVNTILDQVLPIQHAAQTVARVDVLTAFAEVAERNRYCKPALITDGRIEVTEGRHPVVEQLIENEQFVPNDVLLDQDEHQLQVITGPNMAGKSVFIRQVAIIVLMAQIGCFVPASAAEISVVDRIFVRSGASDVITSGLSTFMVEMVETAQILQNATRKSLIVMDEIGRGTSTYDGISIAWAVAEYLLTQKRSTAKTLFATHYHELQELAIRFPDRVRNMHMAVEREDGRPVFLHTLLPGGASHSFGIDVAELAGVPQTVLEKAREVLARLEGSGNLVDDPRIGHRLRSLDITNMTPLQALQTLDELKSSLETGSIGTDTK